MNKLENVKEFVFSTIERISYNLKFMSKLNIHLYVYINSCVQ